MTTNGGDVPARILVIDDTTSIHDDFRKVLNEYVPVAEEVDETLDFLDEFAKHGEIDAAPQFVVDSAYQGEEGLELVKRAIAEDNPYAVAFVDVCMPPGWSGIETIEEIWKIDADIQIVICTAYGADKLESIGNSSRKVDEIIILRKPFDVFEAHSMAHSLHHKWKLKRETKCLDRRTKSLESIVSDLKSHGSELERVLATRTAAIEATRDVAVFALANLADSRDPETGEHLARMRTYSQILAEHLGKTGPYSHIIDNAFLDDLFRSSPLHDIGKVGLPDSILLKPGKLTSEEFDAMKRHTEIGARTLEDAARSSADGSFFSFAAKIARHHHERWDGTGYPDGIRGLDIPLEARIVAVADVFDALTSKRVYKDAYPVEEARKIIEEGSGNHFDPEIVEAFFACYDRFKEVVDKKDTSFRQLAPRANRSVSAAGVLSPRREYERVVIVDSDANERAKTADWLADEGYDVYQTDVGEQSHEVIKELSPQFVVVNSRKDRLVGNDLCRWVRTTSFTNYVYTIIIAENQAEYDELSGGMCSSDEILPRDFVKGDLISRIRSAGRVVTLEDQLRRLAVTDMLTGLPTRQSVEPQMHREWQRSVRHCIPLSCAIVDVDNFDQINERHGYEAGDTVLKEIATIIQSYSRLSDFSCRISGDSFLLLLIECNEKDAARCVDRIRDTISRSTFSCGGVDVRSSVSIGVAQRYHDTPSFDELVSLTEQALLVAKQSGRDRVTRFRRLGDQTGSSVGAESDLLAHEVMTTPITCLRDSAMVWEASKFMVRFRLNSIPVVDAEGRLVGILSEKDLLADMASDGSRNSPISNVMTTDVVCFDEGELAQSICTFLCEAAMRRVVIVKDGRPTGIVSRGTLLRHFCRRDTVIDQLDEASESEDDFNARIGIEVGQLAAEVRDAVLDEVSTST